jgi:putative DNA primase/helicase
MGDANQDKASISIPDSYDARFATSKDLRHLLVWDHVGDRWRNEHDATFNPDEVIPFPECRTFQAAREHIKHLRLDRDANQPPILTVNETAPAGEVAVQLRTRFKLATMEDTKEIYVYQNGVYVRNAEPLLAKTIEDAYDIVGLDKQPTNHFINEVLGHLQRATYIKREEFDKTPSIINLKNGLFNLATGELQPHDPNYYSRVQLRIAYNPLAECPLILKFLKEVQPDEDDFQAVIEQAAVPLLRSNYLQKAFMYVGSGRNGKSVWFKVLNALYGVENVSHNSIHSLQSNRFAPATLDGMFANIHDDISAQEIRHTGILKQIIAGDPIQVEHKGQALFTMRSPHPTLFFSANQLPEVEDLSDAWMRRWEYLDWEQEFDVNGTGSTQADRGLAEKLTTQPELEGLLVTLLNAACNINQNRSLSRERTIGQVREEWVKRSDVTLAFFQETIQEDAEGVIEKSQLIARYVEWCRARHYLPKGTQSVWRNLRDNYTVIDFHPKVEGERQRCWKGIKWQPQASTRL